MAHGKEVVWYENARSAFERELARPDRRGASRAVLGEGLGRLLKVDPDWIKPKIPDLFGDSSGITAAQQIALTTAMAVHYYHRDLYDILAPSMIAAMDQAEPLIAGWRGNAAPLQRIGEWTIDALIYGHKTIDDPVARAFFGHVDPKTRGEAIGRIAWSFMHAETVNDAIRDRFANLWDARIEHVRSHSEDKAELNEFYWVIKSGKFDSSWWLPRFRDAAALDPELASERYMLGKEIAAAADSDPRGAFEVTRLLLADRDQPGAGVWDLSQNAVPIVVARAIASSDEQLKREAVQFMNYLGENVNPGLEKQVNEVLSGEITQKDVSE